MTAWPPGKGAMAARIRAHDWAATPLGPMAAWPERLKVMVEQVLASPLVASLVCGPEHVLIYNEAAARLYGDRHPAALGRPLSETFPEGWATVVPFYERAFAGETVQVAGQPLDTRGEGEANDVFDALLTPVRETDGHVAFVHMTGFEIGARMRVEAAMRESEAKFRTVFEASDQGFVIIEMVPNASGDLVDYRYIEVNPAFKKHTGLVDIIGKLGSEVSSTETYWLDVFRDVALTGRSQRHENVHEATRRWYDIHYSRVPGTGLPRIAGVFSDVTARKRAAAALRESEERQAFLLRLSDALRGQPDADATANRALHMLSEQMGLDRCYIAAFHIEKDWAEYLHQVGNDRIPPMPAGVRLSAFPKGMQVAADRSLVIDDLLNDASLTEMDRQSIGAFAHRALVAAFLRKGERHVLWTLCAVTATPRHWTPGEIAMVEETAERIWAAIERVRREAALRESEERLRQFGEASSDVLWIRDAETLQWVYLTPAFERIYGIDRATALAGDNMTGWLDLIVPDDRQKAIEAIERVRAGERVAFEYRVRQDDGTVRWLRNTDFPMRDAAGKVCWIGGVGRDVTAEKASAQRLEVLVNELQHRSRNLLGVVTAMANRTVGRGSSAESFLVRLKALSRAQALLSQGGSDTVAVEALVRAELAAHADNAPDRIVIDGPAVTLTSQQVQNFALALHELTTNAVKYGALKGETGRLSVTWELIRTGGGPHLALNWVETGVDVPPEAATRRGYGRELIEQALAYALGGRTDYALGAGGVRCRIELPIA